MSYHRGTIFGTSIEKEESFEKQMRDLSFEKDSKIGKNKKYRLNMKDFDKIIGRNAITMIYFFTSRCVPCEAMEPALDQFERRMAGRVDIYRINTDADENAYLLYRYMIRTTPTLIYFRKGDEIRRCEGPLTYKELLALQEQVETVEHVCLN
jgi:thioredoxin 1